MNAESDVGAKRKIEELTSSDPLRSLSEYLSGQLKIEWTDTLTLFDRSILEMSSANTNRHQFFQLLLEDTLRYLYVLAEDPTSRERSPSEVIDQGFHCLLLDPVNYYLICNELMNLRGKTVADYPVRVLHHTPLGGDNSCMRNGRLQRTYEEYKRVFGEPSHDFWPDIDPKSITVYYMDNMFKHSWEDDLKHKVRKYLRHTYWAFKLLAVPSSEDVHLFKNLDDSSFTLIVSDPNRPRVFIESLRHNVIAVDVNMTTTTVGDVKRTIEKELGQRLNTQLLFLRGSTQVLWPGDALLNTFRPSSEFSLTMCVRPVDTDETIEIFVKTLSNRTLTLYAGVDQPIEEVHQSACVRQGYPSIGSLHLVCAGRVLRDGTTLRGHNIRTGATLYQSLSLRGC